MSTCCEGNWCDWHPHSRDESWSRFGGCTLIVARRHDGWAWRADTLAGSFVGKVDDGPGSESVAKTMATWAARCAITLDKQIAELGGARGHVMDAD